MDRQFIVYNKIFMDIQYAYTKVYNYSKFLHDAFSTSFLDIVHNMLFRKHAVLISSYHIYLHKNGTMVRS